MPSDEVRAAIERAIVEPMGYDDPPGARTTKSVRELVRLDLQRFVEQLEVLANEGAVVRLMEAAATANLKAGPSFSMRAALLALAKECGG